MRFWRTSALVLAFLWLAACSNEAPPSSTDIPVSTDPDQVSDDTTSITGQIVDYDSGEPIPEAIVTSLPRTEYVKTDARGSYILVEGVTGGQMYTLTAEADGYSEGQSPALAAAGKTRNIDIALVPSDRALPIVFDPPVIAMPPRIQTVTATMRSRASETLKWQLSELPSWLDATPSEGELQPEEQVALTFGVEAEEFAAAIDGLPAGESLWGDVEVTDDQDRVAPLRALAVPASAGSVDFEAKVLGESGSVVRQGRTALLRASALYGQSPIQGAPISFQSDGPDEGLSLVDDDLRTGATGVALGQIRAEEVGNYTVRVGLPSYPGVDTVETEIQVVADNACGLDNGGCGDPRYTRCSVDENGAIACQDIDECEVDDDGENGCGIAEFWDCTNNQDAPPTCEDVDECATDNGGCGDPQWTRCIDNEGAAPTCEDIDECATDNGGCGDAQFYRCIDNVASAPTCEDIDECAVDANGENGCGVAEFWSCTNNDGAPPTCEDVDECAPDANGMNGCGEAQYWNCTDNEGAAPTCTDIDECADGTAGCNPTWETCVNQTGSAPLCEDIDECATNNGGCGDPQWNNCINQQSAPPICEDIDECEPDANGLNDCGVAQYWDCVDQDDAAPICTDIDECQPDANGMNGCGEAQYWDCTNNVDAPPTCQDIDECATNDGGCDTTWTTCVNNVGAAPTCQDINECATNNGGCGDPTYWNCIDQDAALPVCEDIDECEVDANGMNGCGEAQYSICTNNVGAAPTCEDIDECIIVNGANGCGDPYYGWTCVNNDLVAPTCTMCTSGTQNLDNDTSNGCEYSCTVATGGEICNQEDDDCDGLVDEGFDLQTDPLNCGSCGNQCTPGSNTTSVTCRGGECLVLECDAGYRDFNGDGSDGCEAQVGGATQTLYVDAIAGTPSGNGSSADPVDTINGGLALASAGDTIIVRAGVYQETVDITLADITIAGNDRSTVIVEGTDAAGPTIEVSVGGVSISGLTVRNGQWGIRFAGTSAAPLQGARLFDVSIADILAPPPIASCGNPGNDAAGIAMSYVNNFAITDVDVLNIEGSDAHDDCDDNDRGPDGGRGSGIDIDQSSGGLVVGAAIAKIFSGTGGKSSQYGGGGIPRAASGVRLNNASGVTVRGIEVESVTGGEGGFSNSSSAGAGWGGTATGILVTGGSANTVESLFADQITGGLGGTAGKRRSARGGWASGVWFSDTSLDTATAIELRNITGGNGGNSTFNPKAARGRGFGVFVGTSSSISVTNVSAWNIQSGSFGADTTNGSACIVAREGANPVEIRNVSCHRISGETPDPGHGLLVEQSNHAVDVFDTIISETATTCVTNNDTTSALNVSYSNTWDCGSGGDVVNATTSGNMYTDEPLFADPSLGNLHLLPTSPLIDKGDPASAYDLEPNPDGCAVNLGAYGNTTAATAAPNANNCN